MYQIYFKTERNSVYAAFLFVICQRKECKIKFFNAVIFKISFGYWKEFYAQFPLCISSEKID